VEPNARRPSDRTILIVIALVALNLTVYWDVRRFDFVNWDDPTYLTENPNVQAGLSLSNVSWALTTGHSPYWHPLTWLSHMLDVSLYGMDPGAHHATSVAIHTASTVLLFLLLRRLTGQVGPSAFVAAVFAVHPLHVESVAWLAERKDVLSGFFLVLTIWMYVRYVDRPGPRRYAGVCATYMLALMSKPMAVTLPFVLLLLDVWPLRRLGSAGTDVTARKRAMLEKLPLMALAGITSIATWLVQTQVGAVAGLSVLPLSNRIQNALLGYVMYVWSTVWPVGLAAFYPLRDIAVWETAAAAAALIAVTGVAIVMRRTQPYVLVGWLWYLITLAPVIGLMQAGEQARADRFMYIPLAGLVIPVAYGSWRSVRWLAAPIVLVLAIVARAQASTWSDSVTLWQHAAQVTRANYIAYENLGQAYREKGDLARAEANYRKALALSPAHSPGFDAVIHNSLGMVLERQGRGAEALHEFGEAVRLRPDFAEARLNLGNALAASGRAPESIEQFRRAIALDPALTEPRVGLGAALLQQDEPAAAMSEYREALRLDPGLAQAHNGLGGALSMLGRDGEAMSEFREALRLRPDLPTAHLNIARLLIKKGDVAEARRHLETALSIDPGYAPARQALTAIGG
jgi:protein O-mannosyl-transferase